MPGRDPFSLPPETVTPGQLYMAMQSLNARLAVIAAEQSRQGKRMDRMDAEISGLVAAWQAGGTLLGLAKAVAILGSGVAATLAAVKLWGGGG